MKDISILTDNGVNVKKSLEIFETIEKYDSILEAFFRTIEENLNKLRSYKEESNMSKYTVLVHSIKSEARYFGFEHLESLAYQHEVESNNNNIYYIYDNFDELTSEIERIIVVVAKYLRKENKAPEPEENNGVMQKITGLFRKKDNTKTKNKQHSLEDKKILVVDDSDAIRSFIQNAFENEFEILLASDGGEAINIIEKNSKIKIIGMFLDLDMPNLDGFSVLEYLREKGMLPKIPVCIITGTEEKEAEEYAFKYQIVGMLKKPFSEADIKAQIDRFTSINSE